MTTDAMDVRPVATTPTRPSSAQGLADAVHGAYVAFITDHDPGWPASAGLGPVMTWDVESALTDGAAYAPATIFTPEAAG